MKLEESQNVEYKCSWHDEYLRWVCGFANAKGGTLWIGIDDDKSIVGVSGAKKLMEDIPNKIKDLLGIVVDVSHNPKSLSPKFYSAVGCFVVTLPNLNGSQESSQESSQETELSDLSAGARKAYALIVEDKKITAAMIAKSLGVSSRMVFKYISELRRIGLRHVGSTKGGHWEVIA